MLAEIRMTFVGNYMLPLTVALLIAGLALVRGKRRLFLIPAMIMLLIVLNPVFYGLWYKFNDRAYWRTLWMIPVIPVCAMLPAYAVRRTKRRFLRFLSLTAGIIALCCCGSFVYGRGNTMFVTASNAAKLPEDVVNVADALLAIDETPTVVADAALSVYLRQYSGRIKSPYSRDIVYGSPSALGGRMNALLVSGEAGELAQLMLNNDYEYLATDILDRQEVFEGGHFEHLSQVGKYGIYRVRGEKTEAREYNDMHQVTAVTTLDEAGNPVNGADGYATVKYEYDSNGRTAYLFHCDENGNGFADETGVAGYRREYDFWGNILKETCLGSDGKPVVAGYSTRVCKYNRKHELVDELYYDANGDPMLRTDTLYACRKLRYNSRGAVIGESYYDLDGKPAVSDRGYAGFEREVDAYNRTVCERYRDADGNPTTVEGGYASYRRSYDDNWKIIEESYYGVDGELIISDYGYAVCQRDYKRNVLVRESYYDTALRPVDIGCGYAYLQNVYDEHGELSLTYFYDSEGKRVNCGSAYLHEYLQSLKGRTFFIAAKDDATTSLTGTICEDLRALGLETDLRGKYRCSYYAVVSKGETREEVGNSMLEHSGQVDGVDYTIKSAGHDCGNTCAIVINGIDYSLNSRGLNIVVYSGDEIESVCFDTFAREMAVTRRL